MIRDSLAEASIFLARTFELAESLTRPTTIDGHVARRSPVGCGRANSPAAPAFCTSSSTAPFTSSAVSGTPVMSTVPRKSDDTTPSVMPTLVHTSPSSLRAARLFHPSKEMVT